MENMSVDTVMNQGQSYEIKRQNFLNDVIKHEGGYVNNVNDRGGETNFGISKRQYPNLDIKNLSPMYAMKIYDNDFLKNAESNYGQNPVAFKMADVQINTGKSTLIMQQALNSLSKEFNLPNTGPMLKEDNLMGNQTKNLYNKIKNAVGQDKVMNKIIMMQKKYYDTIVSKDSTQQQFLDGWYNRAEYRPE
tara:strand:+ start:1350 stop:1922 length:573 start_codon:yes stop_codon:yes gene_type:complete